MKSILAAAILLVTIPAIAQHDGSARDKLKALDFLVGTWAVDVQARLSMQGPWENSKATSVIKKTLDNTLIEEEFTGSREGKPFLAKTLLAINNQTDRFQRIFIDAPHGVLVDFEGIQEENKFVFDKTWVYANGNTVKLRAVYTIESTDSFTLETMRMPAGSTTWDVSGRSKYSRTN